MDPCHIGVRHGLTSHPSLRPRALGGQNQPNEGHSSQCASPRHSFALSVTVQKTPKRQKTTVQTDCRHVTARRSPWGNRTPNPKFMRSLVVGTERFATSSSPGTAEVTLLKSAKFTNLFLENSRFARKKEQRRKPRRTRAWQLSGSYALAGSREESSPAGFGKPDPSQCAQNQRHRQDCERRPKAMRLSERSHDKRRSRTPQAAHVQSEALSDRAHGRRINLGRNGSKS